MLVGQEAVAEADVGVEALNGEAHVGDLPGRLVDRLPEQPHFVVATPGELAGDGEKAADAGGRV